MTTSVKNVVAHLQNMGNYLITPNNYDDNNYDDNNYDEVTQYKSISHGNDFNKYLMSLKNKSTYITEGFNGHDDLTKTSRSVLLQTQLSSAQQEQLTKLKKEYLLNQTNYNSLMNAILPGIDNSATFKKLSVLETTLNNLSRQINTLNDLLKNNISRVNDQISTNSDAREEYMDDIVSNNKNEANMNDISNNIQNMLNDSDITTLQKNYSYILLSILAAASILVAMNVIKK
jgi:hypothetical protein